MTVAWPSTLEWRNVTVSNPEWGVIQVALLQAKVSLLKLLTGEFGFDVTIQTDESSPNSGVAKGTVTGSSFSFDGPLAVKGHVHKVDLSALMKRHVSRGTFNGEFLQRLESHSGGASVMKGDGVWKAEVRDLAIDQIPLSSGLTLSVGFVRVAAALSCRDAVCDVTELKGDGPDGSFTGDGTITVQQPFQHSQLALSVMIVPGTGFASKGAALGFPPLPAGVPLTVKVVGTLAQPRVAL
jgi:type II secretion system protein N